MRFICVKVISHIKKIAMSSDTIITSEIDIQEWIDSHNKQYTNYCEAIILPNGSITYAIPSHQIRLRELKGVPYNPLSNKRSKEEIALLKEIPFEADVCEWLCEDLKTISVWYNWCVIPINYTESSLTTLIELIKHGCVRKDLDINISIEKSLISLRNQERFNELKCLFNKRNKVQEEIRQLFSSIN